MQFCVSALQLQTHPLDASHPRSLAIIRLGQVYLPGLTQRRWGADAQKVAGIAFPEVLG